MNNLPILVPRGINPNSAIKKKLNDFLHTFEPYELKNGSKLTLYIDEKSEAYYFVCHLPGNTLVQHCDLEASLEGDDEDEIYKLNRDITEDQVAYKTMEQDALNGRSFEDMVVEYDTSYRPKKPLKVYGGQHRLRAIERAIERKGDIIHGIRVYFDLSREQKVEIATVNNTSIAVPNDLLDRMREQLLGSELRDWCQKVGLLDIGKDFPDRRNPDMPTVRIARTLLVNFYRGIEEQGKKFHQPILCKSGGIDEDYMEIRKLTGPSFV